MGVAIALHDLARNRGGLETEPGAGVFLDGRRDGGVGADGAGDLAIVDLLGRCVQVLDALPDIVDPNCQLEPEGDRFRVDSVGAAGHESVFVLDRPAGDGLLERCEVFEQDVGRSRGAAAPKRYRRCHTRSARRGCSGRSRRPIQQPQIEMRLRRAS